ncbi:hypothetical protein SAMN04489761_2455 [Tenacibaculum sp. MAR_2009_124]|uniref:hypothetical protein n=1 Tax=Tenacibaculum sp. MAR_2009_124 TaxID=1250059 RepID=UPI00089A2815|nr:hypothetical protein [Tenacibaculum sp. MAR_2009_124]SEC23847.1 hypothetical protein SAMN04489761_2455 [Tenacibaculum sp. MAR_2009_124]
MRKSIAIFLLLTLHAHPIANGVVIIDFLLNQEYIKEFLCINKEKPELACNGKCYLTKQLEETQNKREQQFPELVHFKYEFVLVSHSNKDVQGIAFCEKGRCILGYDNNYSFQFINDIFHPPSCLNS